MSGYSEELRFSFGEGLSMICKTGNKIQEKITGSKRSQPKYKSIDLFFVCLKTNSTLIVDKPVLIDPVSPEINSL